MPWFVKGTATLLRNGDLHMGFLDFLFGKNHPDSNSSTDQKNYQQEDFYVVGTSYYAKSIQLLGALNPDWRKTAKTLVSQGKAMQCIYKYQYVNRPVKLIPEPSNREDRNAVIVQIAGEKVGYISRDDNLHVKDILSHHTVIFISAFISGGPYKVIAEKGDIQRLEKNVSISIRIRYK